MRVRVTQVEQTGGSHEQVARHLTLPPDCSCTTVTGLEPGVTYKFIVEAVTSVHTDGDSPAEDRRTTSVLSKPLVARTRAPCEPPRPLVTAFTPSTVRLQWRRPLLDALAGAGAAGARHVRLSLEGYRLDINGQPHMRLSAATHECTLIKCRPGKTYSITLVALTCTDSARKARNKKVSRLFDSWLLGRASSIFSSLSMT